MSRQKRKMSKTGMYHIMFRGINKQNIFEQDSDYLKLKEIIKRVKTEMNAEVYAYCFMSNHVHLFVKEKEYGDISKIMTKILSRYALWFNVKYERSGVLFSNRYKSEPVEDERYYFNLMRYIHQNPVKAYIVSSIDQYTYSSYREYVCNNGELADINFFLGMFDENRDTAIKEFIDFNSGEETESFEMFESQRKNPCEIKRTIMSEIGGKNPEELKNFDKKQRDEIIKKLVFEKKISKTALERATGISRATIIRICK